LAALNVRGGIGFLTQNGAGRQNLFHAGAHVRAAVRLSHIA
jgi:hypothetical protein